MVESFEVLGKPPEADGVLLLKHQILHHFSLISVSETKFLHGNDFPNLKKMYAGNSSPCPYIFDKADCFIVNKEWTPLPVYVVDQNITLISKHFP
jgi:hypothetical protein